MDFNSLTESFNAGQNGTLTAQDAFKNWCSMLISGIVFLFFAAIGLPFLVLELIGRAIKALFNTLKQRQNETEKTKE